VNVNALDVKRDLSEMEILNNNLKNKFPNTNKGLACVLLHDKVQIVFKVFD